MADEHWSEWREHTPGPCPVPVGTLVQAILEDGHKLSPMLAEDIDWCCPGDDVTRYRIRQYPQAFELLRQRAEDPQKMAEVV